MSAKQKEHKEKEESVEEEVVYTKFEKARMIGSRALQLSMGAPFLLKLSEKELEKAKYDPISIAIMEFDEGILPITVKRPKMEK
ncbi:DNA-directed RNA polymerase subunit K [Candidatus Woesearchaeota archaeon]|nr:DNA-directed RNA polymerase subunit K [Candidatus Woesearchaeota archaeon]